MFYSTAHKLNKWFTDLFVFTQTIFGKHITVFAAVSNLDERIIETQLKCNPVEFEGLKKGDSSLQIISYKVMLVFGYGNIKAE